MKINIFLILFGFLVTERREIIWLSKGREVLLMTVSEEVKGMAVEQ